MQQMDKIFIITGKTVRLVTMSKMLIYLQKPAYFNTEKPLVKLRLY